MTDYEEVEVEGWEWCVLEHRAVLTGAHSSADMHYPLYYKRPKKKWCRAALELTTGSMTCELRERHGGMHSARDTDREILWSVTE